MASAYAIQRQVGSAGELLPVFTGNTTTGVGLANVVASTVGFAWYRNDMATASTGTCSGGTLGTYTASSWVQALSTGMLGWYNFGIPPGVFASGNSAAIRLTSALMPEVNIFIELTKTDNQTFFSSQTLSTNALVNVNKILGSTPVTSVAGMYSVNVSTILGSVPVTSAAGTLKTDLTSIYGSAPVTTAAGVQAVAWDLGRTANLTSTIALTATTISTNALVNVNLVLGSTPVTSAAGMFTVNVSTIHGSAAVTNAAGVLETNLKTIYGTAPVTQSAGILATTFDLGRTANLTSTVALSATTISTNQLVNVNQILGTAPVTNAAGVLETNLKTIFGSAPVTTAAGVLATTWDLGRTANLTSTVALSGTTISTNQAVNVNQILGSAPVTSAAGTLKSDLATIYGTAPVTTAAGKLSVGITGTQTYDITGSLSGSVGSVTGAVASVTGAVGSVAGLNAALLDVSVSSRLAAVGYTAPDNTGIATVSSKTAQMTFTTTNQLDVNVQSINDVAITGDGSATPFKV